MQFKKETKGGWFHPSVKPPCKLVLCKVCIHPRGSIYYAVWDLYQWLTFSSDKQAALNMSHHTDIPFYWQVVKEIDSVPMTSKPPGTGWYKVKMKSPAVKHCVFWCYWNGVDWSQLFPAFPHKSTRLVFSKKDLIYLSNNLAF